MKVQEFRELSPDELQNKARELNEEEFNLKFQHATGALENPMRLGQGRREIARVLTVTREKELAAYEEQVDAG